ncbi:MAG: rod shape-determining protein MreC [Bacteroidetes bacterium]|uniref:Cell shape-determining protein MreC n=1 Tax=Candidatus Limisoma faecipullorum TaxID=2840854 RepID=A0A9D9INR6_9BACT|nr:rod shape-determining protein MreC [Candidatus Limisoma faecipullorum]
MRNLISFLIRHSSWFVFLLYVFISLFLLFQNNPYQQYVYLTSANSASASIYKVVSGVTSYFNLQSINNDLQERNALLEMEVINLKRQLDDCKIRMIADSISLPDSVAQSYEYYFAGVINNSVSRPMNYITIDKGSSDGIEPEMGVVDQNGVVGIVSVVSKHAARVISLLNPNMKLSCKVKGSDYFGSLYWDGVSPHFAVLEEMPRHVVYQKGDTIVTSGYSAVFPEGLIVGVIESGMKTNDDNFIALRVRLSTDFTRLSTVRAIKSNLSDELKEIETEG